MWTYLASIMFAGVAIVFTILAAFMNWHFGQSLGRTDFDQLVFGAIGLGVDVAKMLLPFLIFWAIKNRRIVVALLGSFCLMAVISYSVAGLVGYVDIARASLTGTVATKKGTAEDLRVELIRKQAQLNRIEPGELPSVIESRLARLRLDARWSSSKNCSAPYSNSTRRYCQGYGEHQSKLSEAQSAVRLTGDIAGLRQQLAGLSTIEAVDGADPRVDVVSRLWGWEPLAVQTWLGLLLVGIVEFMSTFGIFIAFNHGELGVAAKRWRTWWTPTPAMQQASAIYADALKPDAIDTDAETCASKDSTWAAIARFVVAVMRPEEGSEVEVQSLYPRYVSWCGENEMTQLDPESFVEALEILCEVVELPLRRDGASTFCTDVRLAA